MPGDVNNLLISKPKHFKQTQAYRLATFISIFQVKNSRWTTITTINKFQLKISTLLILTQQFLIVSSKHNLSLKLPNKLWAENKCFLLTPMKITMLLLTAVHLMQMCSDKFYLLKIVFKAVSSTNKITYILKFSLKFLKSNYCLKFNTLPKNCISTSVFIWISSIYNWQFKVLKYNITHPWNKI